MDVRRDMFAGRVAVVTGSSRGLGFAMVRVLGRYGASVVLASRSGADVADTFERLRTDGIEVSGRCCDMAELADVEALLRRHSRAAPLTSASTMPAPPAFYGPTASAAVEDFARSYKPS